MKDLQVTVRDNKTDMVTVELPNYSIAFDGIRTLVQRVTKLLLTTPGRDIFAPNIGSGIKKIKRSMSEQQLQDFKRQIAIKIINVRDQIIALQANVDLPPEEILVDLKIVSVDYSMTSMGWTIILNVISAAGSNLDLKFLL